MSVGTTSDVVEINSTLVQTLSALQGLDTKTASPNKDATGLYYIYPWDESFYWRFPLDNATCKDAGLQHYMMENSGVG